MNNANSAWVVGVRYGDWDRDNEPVAAFNSEAEAIGFANAGNAATDLGDETKGGEDGRLIVMHYAVPVLAGVPLVRALHTAVLRRGFALGWIAEGRVEAEYVPVETSAVTGALDRRAFALAGEALSLHTNDSEDLVICGNDKALVEAEYRLQWRVLAAVIATA